MEEAMHFLDEVKNKYLHQVEQAIEDWDYQDFSPDKRCALLENEEVHNVRDDPDEETIKPIPKSVRKAWVGLTPDAELEDYDCAQAAVKVCGFEAKLVAVCTPPGGIQGIPDAESVQRLLAQIPRLDAVNVTAAFAARLQDDDAQHSWQVRAKAIVLMQMLVEIKPFAGRYIPAFLANSALLQQLDALRTGTHKQVIREGARKLLSLIRSNGANPAFILKGSPASKPHVRHVQLGNKQKKTTPKPAPVPQPQQQPSKMPMSAGNVAVNKAFRPELVMSKSTALLVHNVPRPSLVMSPKVSQAVQASWRRRNSLTKDEDDNLMPFQKPPTAPGTTNSRASWVNGTPMQVGGMARQPSITSSSSRLDSGRISAFSFVQ